MSYNRDESINKGQEYFAVFAKKSGAILHRPRAKLGRAVGLRPGSSGEDVDIATQSRHRAIDCPLEHNQADIETAARVGLAAYALPAKLTIQRIRYYQQGL